MSRRDWRLRIAEPSDAAALAALLTDVAADSDMLLQAPGEPIPAAQIRAFLTASHGRGLTILAEVNNLPIGVIMSHAGETANERGCFSIALAIAAPWRGQGLGRVLITALTEWARQHAQGWRLELTVIAGNQPARRLYQRMGFVEEGVLRGRFRLHGQSQDEIRMGLLLRACPLASLPPSPCLPLGRPYRTGPTDTPQWFAAAGDHVMVTAIAAARRGTSWRRRHAALASLAPQAAGLSPMVISDMRGWAMENGIGRLEVTVAEHETTLRMQLQAQGFELQAVRKAALQHTSGHSNIHEIALTVGVSTD